MHIDSVSCRFFWASADVLQHSKMKIEAKMNDEICLGYVGKAFNVIMSTNISRIILSQSIKSLNLHEYAIVKSYEKQYILSAACVHDASDWL